MSRSALTAAVAATACLAAPAGASACLLESGGANAIGSEPSAPVHFGDAMQFTISKLDGGAAYRVFVDDRLIAEGTKEEPGIGPVRDTFSLPDYGPSPRRLTISVYVEHAASGSGHEEGEFKGNVASPTRLRYVPLAAPQATPQAEQPSGPSTAT